MSRASRRLVLLSGVVLTAGLAFAAWATWRGPRVTRGPDGYAVVEGAEMYRFDPVLRVETLWRREPDGTYRQDERPDPARLARHRAALLEAAGLATLDEIPRERADEARALEAIGYL